MMTWMTRMSFFDTAADLEVDLLATSYYDSVGLFDFLVYQEGDLAENHPAVRMWQGYHVALGMYAAATASTLVVHGISVGLETMKMAGAVEEMRREEEQPFVLPPWIKDTDVLRSHRSNIVRRWPEYADVWPGTPERMPYLWPFVDDEGGYSLMVSKHDKQALADGDRALPKTIAKKVANL